MTAKKIAPSKTAESSKALAEEKKKSTAKAATPAKAAEEGKAKRGRKPKAVVDTK
jgi:hypothetical protein